MTVDPDEYADAAQVEADRRADLLAERYSQRRAHAAPGR